MADVLKVRVDTSKINTKDVTGPGGLTEKALSKAAGAVRDQTKRNITSSSVGSRVDTGRMRQSVDYHLKNNDGKSLSAEVGIYVRYAEWQENGTAQNGAGFIYPRRAKMLRFKGKSGKLVFAKKVRGVRGGKFLTNALKSLSAGDFDLT